MSYYQITRSILLVKSIVISFFLSQGLNAQDSLRYFSLEFSFGKNAPAFTDDSNLDDFLIGIWGRQFGFSASYLWQKSKFLYDVSGRFGIFGFGINFPNLDYEFNYPEESSNLKGRGISARFISLDGSIYKPILQTGKNKSLLLFGLGLGLSLTPDITWGKKYIFHDFVDPENKRHEYFRYKFVPRDINLNQYFILKTKAYTSIFKKMTLSIELSYEFAPFVNYPFQYRIFSKDGTSSGMFYQKFNGFAITTGLNF